jgi:glycosyltransferase involved in cell wall biosynthesis
LEVIVVVDGPDPATVSALEAIQCADSRLRVLPLEENVGGSGARNAGVEAAEGEWIALLDDDDEWMPQKLAKQLALGEKSSHRFPVISCKVVARTPTTEYVWPRTEPFLPVGDYVMQRRGLFQGEGGLQCSTLVARTELFRNCPFTSGLRAHQDWDWLIRAFDQHGAGLEFVHEPLTLYHAEESRATIGSSYDWRYSLDWVNRMHSHLAPETYASFLLTFISGCASDRSDWSAFVSLLVSAFRKGKPRAVHLGLYLGMWIIPRNVRRSIRRVFLGSPK